MAKHQHSIKYSAIHLQITAIFLMTLFYFVPLVTVIYATRLFAGPFFFPANHDWLSWLALPLLMFAAFYAILLIHILLVGIVYRLVPAPVTGKRVPTYSRDWLLWGIKAEIWKMVCDITIIYSVILKAYSLRFLLFKLIGLRLDPTSIIVTDVRIYDPHLLRVGKNVLLPVYSVFSGHLITGNTMYMEKIIIGDNVSLGARSGFAPGVEIGNHCTLGFGVLFGLNVKVGQNTMIDSRAAFSDDVDIGNNVFIGKDCFFGRKARVADNIKIPDYTRIPAKAVINNKADLQRYRLLSFFRPGGNDGPAS